MRGPRGPLLRSRHRALFFLFVDKPESGDVMVGFLGVYVVRLDDNV